MAALSEPMHYDYRGLANEVSTTASAMTDVYKGAMMVYDPATGKIAFPTDVADAAIAGVYRGQDDDTHTFLDGDLIVLDMTEVFVPDAGAAQTDAGKYGYVATTGDWTLTAGAKTRTVLCTKVEVGVGRWISFLDRR